MEEKRRFKAEIAGKSYTIVGKQSAQHMEAVTHLVNHQMDQLHQIDPSLSKEDLAILMAVNAVSDQIIKENRIMELESLLDSQDLEAPNHRAPRNTVTRKQSSSSDSQA